MGMNDGKDLARSCVSYPTFPKHLGVSVMSVNFPCSKAVVNQMIVEAFNVSFDRRKGKQACIKRYIAIGITGKRDIDGNDGGYDQ